MKNCIPKISFLKEDNLFNLQNDVNNFIKDKRIISIDFSHEISPMCHLYYFASIFYMEEITE